MSVNGEVVANRLRLLGIADFGVEALLAQLGPAMPDLDYRVIAIAIARAITRKSEGPAAWPPAASGQEAHRVVDPARPR